MQQVCWAEDKGLISSSVPRLFPRNEFLNCFPQRLQLDWLSGAHSQREQRYEVRSNEIEAHPMKPRMEDQPRAPLLPERVRGSFRIPHQSQQCLGRPGVLLHHPPAPARSMVCTTAPCPLCCGGCVKKPHHSAEAHPLLLLLVPVLCLLLLLESPAVTNNQLGLTHRQDEQFALHRAALAPHPAAATRGRPEEGHCPSPLGPDEEPWATPGAVQGATQRREGQSSRSCFKQWDQTGEISSFSGMDKSIRHGGAGQTSPSELKTGRQCPLVFTEVSSTT